MYANLSVEINDERVAACEVLIEGTRATIVLDAADDSGSTAEPAGVREVDLASTRLRITADF